MRTVGREDADMGKKDLARRLLSLFLAAQLLCMQGM